MSDLINRADAIGAVHEYYQKRFTENSKWDADAKMFVLEDKTIAKDNMEICNIINALPSADAVQGEWIYDGQNFKGGLDWCHCSECGYKTSTNGLSVYRYCPNCGAKMKGGDE